MSKTTEFLLQIKTVFNNCELRYSNVALYLSHVIIIMLK
jgi:hypothetical protein